VDGQIFLPPGYYSHYDRNMETLDNGGLS